MAACRMSEIFHQHRPVLLNEAIENLITSPQGIYVDATFGRGSHARAILNRLNNDGCLIAFDKDQEAIAYAKQHFSHDRRFKIFHNSYAELEAILTQLNMMGQINGILFDLGVSSPQLDNPDRGFSFSQSGKLDMRMDQSKGMPASEWLATIDEEALADVLWQYGEERFSRRIAHAIVDARKLRPITTTGELAAIIKKAMPSAKVQHKHPATRSFQAIRIAVNDELNELTQALSSSFTALTTGGRLCVISFHSLEDRIVKQFIRHYEKDEVLPRKLPIKASQFHPRLKSIAKPIKASVAEVNDNPRARSAILRITEKLS